MNKIWLIGASAMAQDYIKVLQVLDKDFIVIGRGEKNAKNCSDLTGCTVLSGGIKKYIEHRSKICTHSIVATGVENLYRSEERRVGKEC